MAEQNTSIITRFAPSPTGFLHIGGARTALFNWLFARSRGGTFLLRIEDTDRKRSTKEAIDAIYDGLKWLGLDWDGEPVSQSSRRARHVEVAQALLDKGLAYRCYASPEELQAMREAQRAEGKPMRYDGRWRDRDASEAPEGVTPVIRFKAPKDGESRIDDIVQGTVTVANTELDDMVLLRADGTPTYMLSVVVDDHDMGITHVVRGDDHFTNAFRQFQLFKALGWPVPAQAHVPLIHGPDGAKLSKRHGALGVDAYRDMGYLPEAIRNYLLRLGWGHGDAEIISDAEAREWFTLEAIGRAPARFDFAKLENLNGHYIRNADDAALIERARPYVEERLGRTLTEAEMARFGSAIPGLKERAKTLVELAENALFYFAKRPLAFTAKAMKLLTDEARSLLGDLAALLDKIESWAEPELEAEVRRFAEDRGLGLGKVAQPLRAALTGSTTSPGIFEVLAVLGRAESLARLSDCAQAQAGEEKIA